MSSSKYQYAFTLHGHSADVRNLCVPSPTLPLLLSASRDGSAIMWGTSDQRGQEWDAKFRVEGPEKRFTSCAGMVRIAGEAYLLIGSSNGVMSAFVLPSGNAPPLRDGELPEPARTLIEHKQNLCCMDTSSDGLIASGSWDKTIIVWKDFQPKVRIEAHEQAIWAVKFVGEDRILTASADNKIKLHSFDCASGKSTVLQEYTGHSQPVRGLSLRPDKTGFWSCGNDSLVNVYFFDRADPVRSLSGHTSFVYGVVALPEGGAISSGEDSTMRIWSETELLQTIPHPATSIWSCAEVPAPSGSPFIASSANDGMIRFFTKNPELAAAGVTKEQWEQSIKERQLDKSQVGDVKHSDLPGMEALGREGKKEGQVMMIKNEGKVEAYQWSSAERTWQQVGQVVDAVGSGRKQLFQGEEYDYVFDVDVAEGVPPLKLPYNVSENPWIAAQRFLDRNELPSSYSEQVVDFIHKNTGGAQLGGQETGGTYVDPYTGAGRYTGASSAASGSGAGQSSDPYTGGGAYSSQLQTSAAKSKGVLPVKAILHFKQINVAAAKGKIAQLNDELKASDPPAAFTAEEESNVAAVCSGLSSASGSGSEGYNPEAFLASIAKWPEAKRFPLLDLARALSATSNAFGGEAGVAIQLLQLCAIAEGAAPAAEKTKDTNVMLVIRALANLFATKNGRAAMADAGSEVLSALGSRSWAEIGKGRQAAATVALNYSILAVHGELSGSLAVPLLLFIVQVLKNEKDDSETIYRAAVALGNLVSAPSVSGNLQVGSLQEAKQAASTAAKKFNEKRLTDLASEIDLLGA